MLFVERNPEVLGLMRGPVMGGTLLALCLSLFVGGVGLAWALGRNRPGPATARCLCVLTVAVFVLFSHQSFHYWLYRLASIRALTGGVLYVVAATFVLALAWRTSRLEAARFAVATFGALLLALAGVNQLSTAKPTAAPAALGPGRTSPQAAAARLSGENVYYVILDGYGSARALQKFHGIDIDPFIRDMARRGVSSLSQARSNYIVTHASLAGTLEMNYSFDENAPRYHTRSDFFPELLSRARPPEAVRRVRAGGYRFVHIGNAWAPCRWRADVSCVDGTGIDQGQAAEVVERYLKPAQLAETLRLARERLRGDKDGTQANEALAQLSNAVQSVQRRGEPTFFFVHHLVPHDPLKADCSRSSEEMSLALYVNALRCVNREVIKLSELIAREDPHALVVFQADHGSGFRVDWQLPLARWDQATIEERTSILNLVRLPAACQPWMREDLSPINTMRLVLACLERTPPVYVEERSYLTTYETAPDFGLVRRVHH